MNRNDRRSCDSLGSNGGRMQFGGERHKDKDWRNEVSCLEGKQEKIRGDEAPRLVYMDSDK